MSGELWTGCAAPVVVRINGRDQVTELHCDQARSHPDDHTFSATWPKGDPVGLVLDLSVTAEPFRRTDDGAPICPSCGRESETDEFEAHLCWG